MKERIRLFLKQSLDTVRLSPVETFLTLLFFVYCALIVEKKITDREEFMALFPLFFSAAFLLNRWLPRGPGRWAYYLMPVLLVPFFWIGDLKDWILSVSYAIALVICPLMIFVCRWKRDNRAFVGDALHYLKNLVLAGLLSGVAFLLVLAIYFSLHYIFPSLPLGREEKVVSYAAMFFFILLLPLIFLTFNRLQKEEYHVLPFLDILTNYVLTPALLIYTCILYVYFLTILFSWSLPRGGIAYMVFIFTIIAVLVKAYQPLQGKRLYDWFFDRFQWISLPALAMFWIGVGYRIHQYGYTQERVYLVVCGAIMTLTVLMFFSRSLDRYLYATLLAIGLLALFTYIPGLTAGDLGIRSQRARLARMAEKLDLRGENGQLKPHKQLLADSLTAADYESFYDSFDYLTDEDDTTYLKKHYGYNSVYDLNREVMPENMSYGRYSGNEKGPADYLYLSRHASTIDISGFKHLHPISYYDQGDNYYFETSQDTLSLYTPKQDTLFRVAYSDLLAAQLDKMGLNADSVTRSKLQKRSDELMTYDHDGYRVLFNTLTFSEDSLRLAGLSIDYLLSRE